MVLIWSLESHAHAVAEVVVPLVSEAVLPSVGWLPWLRVFGILLGRIVLRVSLRENKADKILVD